MAINFATLKGLTIPEGIVKKITRNSDGVTLWENIKYIETIPSQSGTLTYTGSALTPTWNNYDATQLTIGGTTSATNAGTYTATFTPKSGYAWSDGTTTAKSISWGIGKAAGSLSISPTTLTLNSDATSGTITVTRAGDGVISAVSNDTSVATVSVSGNKIIVHSVNDTPGTATITVSVAAGTNYTAPSSVTCEVTAEFVVYTTMEIQNHTDIGGNNWVFTINGVDYSQYFNVMGLTNTTINVPLGATASVYMSASINTFEYGVGCYVNFGTEQAYSANTGEELSCTFTISEAVYVEVFLDMYGGWVKFTAERLT